MPEYRIYIQEIYDVWYDVQADTEEEAWEAYYEGELIESGREYVNVVDGTEEIESNTDAVVPPAAWSFFGKDEEDIL